jgi:hypothetical protein
VTGDFPPTAAQHQHFSCVGRGEALADFDGGGLPRAIGTEKAEAFPGQHLEIEVIDGDHVPIDLAEAAERESRGWHAGK